MRHERLVICGSGPAGLTAALYAARANLEPVVLHGNLMNGQLTQTTDVENYPGFPEGVQGLEMMERFQAQAERFGTRFEFAGVESCDLSKRPFTLKLDDGSSMTCDALIIATGATAKWLDLPKIEEFRTSNGRVSACATCDGAFYKGHVLAVVGGGDTALEEATFLTRFGSKVYVLVRSNKLRASKPMQARAFENPKLEFLWNSEIREIVGEKAVEGLVIENTATGERRLLDATGLFVAIGHKPNTDAFTPWIDHDEIGYLKPVPGRTATNIPGVFACGDAADHYYRQAVTAAGTGCAAAIECERWLESQGGHE
jgi:thioredoxin reductase (NADPH)